MRLTIIADDGVVGLDGLFRAVDLSGLHPNIHAVQWNGERGHVEYRDRRPETPLSDVSEFLVFIDRWHALTPPAQPA